MFCADEVVLEARGFGFGDVGDGFEPLRETWLSATVGLWDFFDQLASGAADLRRVGAHLAEDFGHDSVALFQQRHEQMLWLNQRMARARRELLGRENRFLGFLSVFVDVHKNSRPLRTGRMRRFLRQKQKWSISSGVHMPTRFPILPTLQKDAVARASDPGESGR